MNFYELFEKKDNDSNDKAHQEVTIADPKAALALKQARAKYTYAKSDLEAFVKMTQDDEEKDQEEIEKIEADNEKQEQEIQDLEDKENRSRAVISKLEKENDLQDQSIRNLTRTEQEYEKVINKLPAYSAKVRDLEKQIADLEHRLQGVAGFVPGGKKSKIRLPDPSEFAIKTPDISQ
jgi:chromosome segregation ATPase